MVMYTGLDRVAEKTGYPIFEAPAWKGRGNGQMKGCKSIIIHHTAGANNGSEYNSYNTVMYGRPGIRGLLSQLGVGRKTGRIYIMGAGLAWHAGAVRNTAETNSYAIGIEIENNGTNEPYSAKTYGSAVALAAELVLEFGLKVSDVKGHKEVAVPKGRKPDPKFSMDQFRRDVQNYINGKKTNTPSKPVENPAPVIPASPTVPKENDIMPNISEERLVELLEEAAEKGARKALSEETVSWRDSVTDEINKFSLPDAVGYLSLHWNREVDRDEAEDVPWTDSVTGETKLISLKKAVANISVLAYRENQKNQTPSTDPAPTDEVPQDSEPIQANTPTS